MAAEKGIALVLRTTDYSETSRIATLWTREYGKIRVLAKGARRLKSSFENALDLLTLCSIVFLRKSSGGLDLLTEAQVVQRFSRLRTHLPALYGAYYLAELLADWTEDYDPHPMLFDQALTTLQELGPPVSPEGDATPVLVMRFEMQVLSELGYRPVLEGCASCGDPLAPGEVRRHFSVAAGGVICANCQGSVRDRQPLALETVQWLQTLAEPGDHWRHVASHVALEGRRVLGQYVTYLLGRRPRLLSYLERGS